MSHTVEVRAEAGATLLDDVRPGWWHEVRIEDLNMVDCEDCILGQLYGWFSDGFDALRLTADDVRQLGFDRGDDDPRSVFADLTAAWRALILQRREERTRENQRTDGRKS